LILETGHGEIIEKPDDKAIKRIVAKTFKKKEHNFVIISHEDGTLYMQSRPMSESIDEQGCRFEYRDSNLRKHFAANNVPVETVISVFQQFNRGDQDFRKAVRWRNISRQFDWSPENDESDEVKEIVATLTNVYAEYEAKKKGRS